ncbi:MAG: hypothetical protein IPJ19_11030 [Planctomycetes bacterium]|nr:hypothetical protein [Planctomycetota bacterium]
MLPPILALLVLPAAADSPLPAHPGDHAPAGVDEARCPIDSAWTVRLGSSYTRFQGLRDGAARVTSDEALAQGFSSVPESMNVVEHSAEIVFAPSDTLAFHARLPWGTKTMRLRTDLGERYHLRAEGKGDVEIGGDLVFWSLGPQSVSAGLTVSLPSGSITEVGGFPGSVPTRLPYALQPGSGTVDLSPRLDWRMRDDPYTYGIELAGTIHNSHNDADYALGDSVRASAWGVQEWSGAWSGSVRVTATRWGNVRGADPDLDPAANPLNDRTRQSGERFDGALGVNWTPFSGKLDGSVFGLEVGLPLAQDLVGPQLSEDWFAAVRVGISF